MSSAETPPNDPGAETGQWISASNHRDLTGKTLDDYRVERLLGHGGMGEVYLAHQISLDRPVALKILKPDLVSNPTYLARFDKEALSAAKLNHPNIVHIYAVGNFEDIKYIAMEYVQGTNLRDYLTRKGPPDLPLALSIMRQTGQAVGVAGEFGLVHRDIKPENLLLTRRGQVKVADFGLCRTPGTENVHLTQQGITLGTPMYMSPEQVQGKPLDHRSDLYSMGVTFYHMLAGTPPFRAETALALALKHVRDTPVSLSVHRPDLPPDLVKLVMKLMAKAPGDRYASATEMLRDLAKIKESLNTPSAGTVSMPELAMPAEPPVSPQPTARRGMPKVSWHDLSDFRPGLRSAAVLLIASVAAGALWGYGERAPDLLSAEAPRSEGAPGLWIDSWRTIAQQSTPGGSVSTRSIRRLSGRRGRRLVGRPRVFSRRAGLDVARLHPSGAHSLPSARLGALERPGRRSGELRKGKRQGPGPDRPRGGCGPAR